MKKSFCLKIGCLSLALYGGSFTSSLTETLTQVPMQGGMIHVEISYHEHAEAGLFHVHLDEGIPQLLPLSQSHPQDDFEPSAPWHHNLSPNGMGMAFNRQYGFVMDAKSDFLPEGHSIRIRQLDASPGLMVFAYRTSHGGSWTPMFGTLNSDPEFAWPTTMFHPAYAAPEGSGHLKAAYEIYLVETATGTRSMRAMPTEFELSWMAGPMAGEPELTISNPIMISWPETHADYTLEFSEDLTQPTWTPMDAHSFVHGGMFHVMVDKSRSGLFYRLVRSAGTEPPEGHVVHTHE